MYEARRMQIVRLVRQRGAVDLKVLQRELGVSEATIRRDLAVLAARGAIRRLRGGAAPPEGLKVEKDWFSAHDPHLKVRIGERAAMLVKPRMTIILENGGTTIEVARALLRTPNITVVTNSLRIAQLLNAHGKCRAIALTGGVLRGGTYLGGPLCEVTLQKLKADIAFIGALAVSPESGIADDNNFTAETKRNIIQSARHVVLLADHKKFERTQPVIVAPLNAVHTLVTTVEIPLATVEAVQALGVEVITC